MRSLDYMGLHGGEKITDLTLDRVFIGSCTNGRIEDLREVARIVDGKRVHANVSRHDRAWLGAGEGAGGGRRPRQDFQGSRLRLARARLLHVPRHEPRSACSPRERCASTSNRNFEGRQGRLGRTHLVSPVMAAAAALAGRFVDIRDVH